MSIHPAHFLTMSNPKRDNRGSTLTSCHSFNVIDCDYNCGCAGYARDYVTLIPTIPKRLTIARRRANSSCISQTTGFCFKVVFTTLMAVPVEHKPSPSFIVTWFSGKFPNLKVFRICGRLKNIVAINTTSISLAVTALAVMRTGRTLTSTLRFLFAKTISMTSKFSMSGLTGFVFLARTNSLPNSFAQIVCQECENYCSETWDVINRHGERIHVCESCLDEHYRLCEHCDEYHDKSQMTMIHDGSFVCSRCLVDEYLLCAECDEYFLADEVSLAIDENGNNVYICDSCRDNFYILCNECEKLFHKDFCHSCKAEEVPA